jgi:hypothetical protein
MGNCCAWDSSAQQALFEALRVLELRGPPQIHMVRIIRTGHWILLNGHSCRERKRRKHFTSLLYQLPEGQHSARTPNLFSS